MEAAMLWNLQWPWIPQTLRLNLLNKERANRVYRPMWSDRFLPAFCKSLVKETRNCLCLLPVSTLFPILGTKRFMQWLMSPIYGYQWCHTFTDLPFCQTLFTLIRSNALGHDQFWTWDYLWISVRRSMFMLCYTPSGNCWSRIHSPEYIWKAAWGWEIGLFQISCETVELNSADSLAYASWWVKTYLAYLA